MKTKKFVENRSKRGVVWLGKSTFKIIIAALCILVLILLFNKVYSIFDLKSKGDQAKAQLENIIQIVDELGEKGVEVGEAREWKITSPKRWWIHAYKKHDPIRPKECELGLNCVCFCLKMSCKGNSEKIVCKDAEPAVFIKNLETPGGGYDSIYLYENLLPLKVKIQKTSSDVVEIIKEK